MQKTGESILNLGRHTQKKEIRTLRMHLVASESPFPLRHVCVRVGNVKQWEKAASFTTCIVVYPEVMLPLLCMAKLSLKKLRISIGYNVWQ